MNAHSEKTLLLITGPTASGKTGLAIELAQQLGTSIISADSRQCYQGMPVGTAQPNEEQLSAVRHYFINAFPVTRTQSAADFERLGLEYLDLIFAKSDTAIACGGTGLYIRALCEGLDEMPPVDMAIAELVDKNYKENGLEWLQNTLLQEDPLFAGNPEWHNPARLIRALAFIRSSGKSISSFRSGIRKERPFRIIKIALELPRQELYERINNRVESMMAAGLVEEVRSLLPFRDCTALQTVGYAELFDYLDGRSGLQDAVDKIKQHTRNYAKRQMTWFRKEKDLHWYAASTAGLSDKILSEMESR